jgi:simple sugar transport system permease protein
MGAGLLLSLLFGIATQYFRANEIVAGLAINLFAFGLTTFLLRDIFGQSGVYRPDDLQPLPALSIPILKDVPILNLLSGYSLETYLAWFMVVITTLLLFRTPFGLAVRSVGEQPEAARTAGIVPSRVKLATVLWSGALAGLAGAHLSTGYVHEFSENMVQGRGFTAVSAIIFGANHPVLTFLATGVFAFADALGFRLQLEGFGLPPEFVKMFPYVLAIVVLTASSAWRQRQGQLVD